MNTSSRQTSDVLAPVADSCPLTAADTVQVFETLLPQVATLHHQGRLHGQLTADRVLMDGHLAAHLTPSAEVVALNDRPELAEVCPPELQGSTGLMVPVEIERARAAFQAAGVDCDPRRIDLYQLGALLCRMLTGQGVPAYLQSPRTRGQVPAPFRPLLDRALGYDAAQRFTDCEQLQAAFAAAAVKAEAASGEVGGEQKPSSFSDTPGRGSSGPEQNTPVTTPPASGSPRAICNFEQLGPYKIICRIGGGGMGDVYKAYEQSLDRYVAIKVLPPELARHEDFVHRFHAEAAAVAKLVHPNIVPIHAIGEDAGHHYFAMQFVNGESLADLLRRHPRLPVDETLTIIDQCLQGLAVSHRQHLIHRDVKPGNILLDHDSGRAMLADFGLVKKIQSGTTLTATGVIMSTVDYIPPEQARGLPVDGRADLYSVGVLMYQMLAGRLPFAADTPTGMIFQHAYEIPPPLAEVAPDVPTPLATMIARMMAKNPDDRYQTADDVRGAIAAFRSGKLSAESAVATSLGHSPLAPGESFLEGPSGITPTTPYQAGGVESWREWLLNQFRRHAPDIADKLENTQQQVDGAVYEYEQRRERLAELVRDAEEVTAELATQAADHRKAAEDAARKAAATADPALADRLRQEQADCERVAADFAGQLAEQQTQNEQLQSQLAEVNGRLKTLRSQRDVLQARLRSAQARIQIEGGIRPSRRWKKAAVLGGFAAAVIALMWFGFGFFGGNAAGHRTVDLLKLVDVGRDTVLGQWRTENGELISDAGQLTRIQFPYEPPEEYDYEIVFTPNAAHDGVLQICTAQGRQFMWEMNKLGRYSALAFIRGEDVDSVKNPTKIDLGLTSGRQYTSVVKVRQKGVQVYLDGKLVADWKTDYKDLDMSRWWDLPNPKSIGLASWESPTTIHSATVTEITGQGKYTVVSDPQHKEVDLLKFVDTKRDAVGGEWRIQDDGLACGSGGGTRLEFPYEPPEEYDYEVTFTRLSGGDSVEQYCAGGDRQFVWAMNGMGPNGGFDMVNGKRVNDNPTTTPLRLLNMRRYTSVVKVRRDGVQAYLDGKLVDDYPTNFSDMSLDNWRGLNHPHTIGVGSWSSPTIFHSAKVIEITGHGKQIVETAPPPQTPTEVNLLKLVDIKRDTVAGQWELRDVGLASDFGKLSRIEFPYQPPEEYDFEIVCSRVFGNDGLAQICAVGGRQFMWEMDSWGGKSGFELVNGKGMNANSTMTPCQLKNGQHYVSLLKVRRDGVQAYLDGKLITEWKTNYNDMDLHPDWHLSHSNALGVGTYESPTIFYSVKVTEITGHGKNLTVP